MKIRSITLTFLLTSLLTGLAIFLYVGPSCADSIGPDCPNGSCDGAIYTLHYSGNALPDSDLLHETFRITLDIDTNTYSGGGSFLDNVAIKVSSPPNLFAASLFNAPGGVGNWSGPNLNETIDANGCSGTGGGGFICLDGLDNGGKGVAVTTGNGVGTDYSFIFDVTVDNGGLFTGLDQASIKARYVDNGGNKIGSLLSENITLQQEGGGGPSGEVPEPATMLLIGSGLLGLAGLRKKFKK